MFRQPQHATMRNVFFSGAFIFVSISAIGQNTVAAPAALKNSIPRPKLVIGIVVDQMRWDFLYRFYDRYTDDGGFKTLLRQGFSCDNTMIPYAPTVTACGHAAIYTGSVPAINGITGNDWWDYDFSLQEYCTGDNEMKTVGSNTDAGKMSPKNLMVTTIGDEMRLATNFRSKVIGIALKDRGAILPAGHSANGAYWYDDKTGDWITSSYYMSDLPGWLKELNAKKLADQYYARDWNTLYPIDSYVQSTSDEQAYEYKPFGKGFPYLLSPFIGKNYGMLPVTPYGNTVTLDVAKAAITGEQLGADEFTDLLAISLSTPDYVGHTFGPTSVEAEDVYLRLDQDLGDFLRFLDKQVGKGQYVVFLSADHGVDQVPAFLREHKIPAGSVNSSAMEDQLRSLLKDKFKGDNLVIGIMNYQVYLDRNKIAEDKLNRDAVYNETITYLLKQPGISRAFALDRLNETTLNSDLKTAVANGDYPSRSGDIQMIYQPQWIDGFETKGTTHGVWNPYDAHIPLLWYGWNITAGKTNRKISMSDIAPTIASMLHVQMPSGSVGHPIEETIK
jgi:predicted AlkP superfamily pyrophosphatase or phosphodiesterase